MNKTDDLSIFLANAHLFYRNAERILQDDRMKYIPVPLDGAIGWVQGSGLKNPTLGTFAEWWNTDEASRVVSADGSVELICRLVGSALTGANRCLCVNETGDTREVNILHIFTNLCRSFTLVNRKFHQEPCNIKVLTLEQTVRILSKSHVK